MEQPEVGLRVTYIYKVSEESKKAVQEKTERLIELLREAQQIADSF